MRQGNLKLELIKFTELTQPINLESATHVYISAFAAMPAITPEEIQNLLPEDEHVAVKNFASPELRERALKTKILTRRILARYLQQSPKTIPIIRTDLSKPRLTPPLDLYQFNLAHTDIYFALGITQKNLIGIDIEKISKKNDLIAISERFFHPQEHQQLLQAQDKEDSFFRIWTQKEAFVKAIGTGLSFGLEQFCVDATTAKILEINDPHYQATTFDSRLFSVEPQHYLCITAQKKLTSLRLFQCQN
jgi:4'-phosphopantetheinyl transferase